MYEVDSGDRVIQTHAFPQSSIGAPLPIVLADEHRILLSYLVEETTADWDGTSIRVVDGESEEPAAIIEFEHPLAHFLGPPNDEAFEGHPLASRGLEPWRNYTIENSSLIRTLERRNRVHEHHRAQPFVSATHYVFAFHDSTFECVAAGAAVTCHPGPLRAAAAEMHDRLF